MTIAACYVSSEGIVFGADSTSTVFVRAPNSGIGGGLHHFNYAQKVFEIGAQSTLGIAVWGMGNLTDLSYRTLIAQFADAISGTPLISVQSAAQRFSERFWQEYSTRFADVVARYRDICANPDSGDQEKLDALRIRQNFSGGFCIGGVCAYDRVPRAFEIIYQPDLDTVPVPTALHPGHASFWGCPNIMNRVVYGIDDELIDGIIQSGKWTATSEELFRLIWESRLAQPFDLPLREAVDWVHTIIFTTIKAMKFSHHLPVCGGPIELAVISSDRPFRWIQHKQFDEALP
jgi:hypothetical protein